LVNAYNKDGWRTAKEPAEDQQKTTGENQDLWKRFCNQPINTSGMA
jgi:hypothetical protein